MSWTPDRIAELEKFWAEGLSTAEIGRQLGVSKNAVVGKAHRMKLPGRQSPIDPSRRQARKAAAPKARPQPKPAARQPEPTAKKPAVTTAAPALAARPSAQARPARARKPQTGPSCQWPFGDPRLPGFHFCGAASEPGKPYCAEHCAVAYNRVSVAQADARADKAAA